MAAQAFEVLCPKCAARLSWSPPESTRLVCRNCRHTIEVVEQAGGKIGARVVGQAPAHEASRVAEEDPLLAKVKRYVALFRTFQALSGLTLLAMAFYWLWNKFARQSAAEQSAYSGAARDQYADLGTERLVVTVTCIAFSILFGLMAAQFRHHAKSALEDAEASR